MILTPNNEIIITPPHTGSRNLQNSLATPAYNCKIILGQTIGGVVDHHYNKLPSEWGQYPIYLVVRNPYDRFIGLYLHYKWACENKFNIEPLSWPDFVAWEENPNWIYRTSITKYMGYSNIKEYNIIRYENLQEEINNLFGQDVNLIPPYHDKHDIKSWYQDSQFINYVNTFFAEEDCRMYNYELFN
jgi:hypothetical protein